MQGGVEHERQADRALANQGKETFWKKDKTMKDDKRCLNCMHEGKICMRQGWGGDEYWSECKLDKIERDRRSFGCEKWEAK